MVKFGIWVPIKNTVLSVDMNFKIDPNIDENIGNYWNCLKGKSQFRWYIKELHLHKVLKISTLNKYGCEKLRTSIRSNRPISTMAINYDILSNQRYVDAFFYMYMDRRVENKYSDFVAKILYLGEQQLE